MSEKIILRTANSVESAYERVKYPDAEFLQAGVCTDGDAAESRAICFLTIRKV